jgi:hypothetical protein
MDDPVAMMSQFSESELACVAGTAETDRLLQLLAMPELASPEEQTQLIGCMEDETVLRLFLTGFIADYGQLSEETSMCIRTAMEGVDLRSIMLAGIGGDEETAMVGSMTVLNPTFSCLNEEEMEAIVPDTGMAPGGMEISQCVMEALGGPEGMATSLQPGDESGILAIFGAAMECGGMQMEADSAGDQETSQCVMERLGGPEGMAAILESGDEGAFMSLFGAAIECAVQMEGAAPRG